MSFLHPSAHEMDPRMVSSAKLWTPVLISLIVYWMTQIMAFGARARIAGSAADMREELAVTPSKVWLASNTCVGS